MSIETMKLALEAVEHLHKTGDTQVFDLCYAPELIPALRTAIEQAQPTAQPAPVQEPLEEEWIAYCWNKSLIGHRISYVQYLEFVREVERAHGIKEKNNG
jgi:hypothetical protein